MKDERYQVSETADRTTTSIPTGSTSGGSHYGKLEIRELVWLLGEDQRRADTASQSMEWKVQQVVDIAWVSSQISIGTWR